MIEKGEEKKRGKKREKGEEREELSNYEWATL
jgi:hypothetical protein